MSKPSGFSLTELLIFILVTTFGITAALFLLFASANYKAGISNSSETNTDFSIFQAALRNYANYAVNLEFAGNKALNGTGSDAGVGFFREFRFQSFNDLQPNRMELLGYFLIETTRSNAQPNSLTSTFTPVAIGFAAPTPEKPGGLYLFTRNLNQLRPENSTYKFEEVTEVRLTNPNQSSDGKLNSIELQITFRKFLSSADTSKGKKSWCPKSELGKANSCKVEIPFKDLQESIVLHFINNSRDGILTETESTRGMYFFRHREL